MNDADAKRWKDRAHHTVVVTDLPGDFLNRSEVADRFAGSMHQLLWLPAA